MNIKTLLLTLIIFIPQSIFAQIVVDGTSETVIEHHKLPAFNNETSINAILDTAWKAEKVGHLMEAMTLLKPVYKKAPGNPIVRLSYARLLIKNGHANKAIAVVQPLANKANQDWRPWFWLGTAQLMSSDLENASTSLDAALNREGNVSAIWVQRAIVEQEREHVDTAVSLLQVAYSIDAENADVMMNYAYALEKSGELSKAKLAYRHFLQATTANPYYGAMRSQILQRIAQISTATAAAATKKIETEN